MGVSAKNWTSSPGSTIGGGGQRSEKQWLGFYNQALAGFTPNGKPLSARNPMPVTVIDFGNSVPVDLNTGGPLRDFDNASKIFRMPQQQTQTPVPDMSSYVMQLGEEDAAIVDVIASREELIQADKRTTFEMRQLINMSSLVPRALTPLIGAEQQHADTAIKLTTDYQEAARKQLVIGRSFLSQMSSAIGQLSGMMPQETVGKNR